MFRPVNRRNRGSPDIRNNMNICLREIFQQAGGCRPASEKTKFRCTVSQKEIRCPDSFCVFRARIVASFVRIHFIRRSNDSVLIEQHQSPSRVHHYEKRHNTRGKNFHRARFYRTKFVQTRCSGGAGNSIPAARPASIDFISHAMLWPSTCMICTPSSSCMTCSGVLPCVMGQ